MRIIWTVFHDSRRFMGITFTKIDLRNPKGTHPTLRSTDGLLRSIESGIISIWDDIIWEFRKKFFS